MTHWTVVGVDPSVPWPTKDTEVEFRGHKLILRPATDDRVASVAFQYPASMTLEDAILLVRQYLSSLSWVERAGIREVWITGGSAPFYLGRGRGRVVTEHFRHDYLPDPSEPRVRLALAFYREGMSSEPLPYRFLSFFKIINILHPTGPQQTGWINANLSRVRDARAGERIKELTGQVADVGAYLYESGRCAVAHAFSQPLVDPENIVDNRRLSADLPVVQALAEILIEHELGVKSRETIWREHLYHLDGFRELLGEQLVARLKAKEPVQVSDIPPLAPISVGVRDKPSLESFVGL